MKERNRIFILLSIILLVALVYYWSTTDHTKEFMVVGVVDANQVVVNARILGRIEKLHVDEGTDVKAGDLIAELDTTELKAQRDASTATIASLRAQVSASKATEEMSKGETSSGVTNALSLLQSAHSQLEEARANMVRLKQDDQRIQSLTQQGVASQQESDQSAQAVKAQQARVNALQDQVRAAEAEVKMAEARTHQAHAAESNVASTVSQVLNAEAQLAGVDTKLSYTRVLAPLSGTVSVRVARQGEVINAGEPIVTIVDFNDTWVRASVPETIGTRIAIGDTFKIRLPSGDIIDGRVIAKAAEGDFAIQRDVSNTKRDIKTLSLKLKVENSGKRLVPGMTADLLLPRSLVDAKPQEAATK